MLHRTPCGTNLSRRLALLSSHHRTADLLPIPLSSPVQAGQAHHHRLVSNHDTLTLATLSFDRAICMSYTRTRSITDGLYPLASVGFPRLFVLFPHLFAAFVLFSHCSLPALNVIQSFVRTHLLTDRDRRDEKPRSEKYNRMEVNASMYSKRME